MTRADGASPPRPCATTALRGAPGLTRGLSPARRRRPRVEPGAPARPEGSAE